MTVCLKTGFEFSARSEYLIYYWSITGIPKLRTKRENGVYTNRCFECLQSTYASGDFYGLQATNRGEEISEDQAGGQTKSTYYLISREIHLSCNIRGLIQNRHQNYFLRIINILNRGWAEFCSLVDRSAV